MAINVKAPLVDQLFAIGQSTGSEGQTQYRSPLQQQGAYHGQPGQAPAPQQSQKGSGGAGALASVAGAAASHYMNQGKGAAPVAENGTGYALGGKLVTGDVGNAQYTGSASTNPLMSLFSQQPQAQPTVQMTQTSNPYALGGLFSS